jgi:hypothetical protein
MICTETLTFDQLDEHAKERARDKYREHQLDYDWWDVVYEDALEVAKLLGIDIDYRDARTVGGKTVKEPCIFFEGFCQQGQGACYEGRYSYRKGSVKDIKQHAPQDARLHRIATDLFTAQRHVFYSAGAHISHQSRYCHKYSMCIEVLAETDDDKVQNLVDYRFEKHGVEKAIQEALGDFADWIFEQLRDQHDYLVSDEAIDELLSDMEFDEDGDICY